MKTRFYSALLLSGSLFLPALSGAKMQEAVPGYPAELSLAEVSSGDWKHTGDITFSNQQLTFEDVADAVRDEALRRGEDGYRVSRLQLMPNGSWSVNAATYSRTDNNTSQEK